MKAAVALRWERVKTPFSLSPCCCITFCSVSATSLMRLLGTCKKEASASSALWCLDSTSTAADSAEIASSKLFSSASNSAISLSLIDVASASAFSAAATSSLCFAISWLRRALRAVSSSMSASSFLMRASASEMALLFSLSFVSHQHAILSYISSSVSFSFSNWWSMSFSRVTTLDTGRFFAAAASNVNDDLTDASIASTGDASTRAAMMQDRTMAPRRDA
mmetsp:Transcript_88431/g.233915  ORF Transcript_88431/g.233915 Transcript_88431/m.233915 type:complete len:221 (-) Transcript_88431:100-762(-)